MIIGTAGHIDHGKTSLVKALTGVDTDVLKEEKERGITLDIGFAYQPTESGEVLGFVDVPGHEKLVRHMLAGASGIDHVLLVVAADDGPMPQTREHLSILDLLGLREGAVALTKCDLVSAQRLDEAQAEVRALLAGSGLAEVPIFPVSSRTGEGLADLRAHLQAAAVSQSLRPAADGLFRLSVDRSFSLAGVGTVVTGTAVAGTVQVGDTLLLTPKGREVRVRGIHAHDRKSNQGRAGQRLALNLTGVDKAEVQRGDWVVHPALNAPTQRLDARLRLLPTESKALEHWSPVHLHCGAEDVMGRAVMLEGQPLQPGVTALVQFELDRPIHALHGDRIVVRDPSAQRTLGGGLVLDIHAPASRRNKALRCALLRAQDQPDAVTALGKLLALGHNQGIDAVQFAQLWNLPPTRWAAVSAAVPHQSLHVGGREWLYGPAFMEAAHSRVSELLGKYHAKNPDHPGLTAEQLQRSVKSRPGGAAFAVWLDSLIKAGLLKRSGPHWSMATHTVELQGLEKAIWERIKPLLDAAGTHPPKLEDVLQRDRSLRKDQVLRTLQRLERMGKLRAVGNDYFIQTPHLLQLAIAAEDLAKQDPNQRLNVKEYREATGISRHLSLPLVEFFDAIGLTQRDAIGRHFRRDPRRFFEV
jgi:selenocysteine-specific elongation factor